jgi:hypothetical protein
MPVIRNQAELENQIWRRLDEKKYNILIPRHVNFGPMIKMTVGIIRLDPAMKLDKDNKETSRGRHFWQKKGGYTFTAPAIKLLSYSAGMIWDEAQTRLEEAHYQDNILMRARYRAVAKVFTSMGTWFPGIGTSEWNRAIDDTDTSLKPDQRQMRIRFSIPLVESAAFARAFYDCLGAVEKDYTREDICKPFVIPVYSYDLDPADPGIKKLLIERALRANDGLYGNGDAKQPKSTSTDSTTEKPAIKPPDKPPAKPVNDPPTEASAKKLIPWSVFYNDWKDAGNIERGQEILRLADLAHFDKKDLATPDRLPHNRQMYFLMLLAEKAGLIEPKKAAVK